MPFLNQIATFINDTLKAGSLKKECLQPALFYGISTVVARKKSGTDLEQLPGIVNGAGIVTLITPDSKQGLQLYHKLLSNSYSYEKKSYGDGYDVKSISELAMVVIINTKLTGKTPDVLEPVVVFGMPQKLSAALIADLKINKCLITPLSSNMDAIAVFKQEFPQEKKIFVNEQMSMFSLRYRVEMTFGPTCVEQCLCN